MVADDDVPVRRLVVHPTDFDDAHRTMERVFLPMAMWPLEPLTAVNMLLDSTQVDQMMTSMVRFGRDIGLRSVEADSYHVAAPVTGVAESRIGLHEPIETTRKRAAVFSVDVPIDIRWRSDCAQMYLHSPVWRWN